MDKSIVLLTGALDIATGVGVEGGCLITARARISATYTDLVKVDQEKLGSKMFNMNQSKTNMMQQISKSDTMVVSTMSGSVDSTLLLLAARSRNRSSRSSHGGSPLAIAALEESKSTSTERTEFNAGSIVIL
jgi:hypothetical protein